MDMRESGLKAILMGSSRVSCPKKTVVRFSGKASAVTAIHSGSPIKQSRVPLAGLHTEVPCPPKPVASIGSAVGVIGRVVVRGEGRVVLLDEITSPKKHARGESSPAKGETKSDGSVNGVGRVMQLDEAMQIEDMEPKTPSSCGSSTQGSPSSVSSSSSRRGRQHKLQQMLHNEGDATPRAAKTSGPFWGHVPLRDEDTDAGGIHGFTLSHLRRVPELVLLAQRVVDAEARRRAREERKQASGSAVQNKSKPVQRPQNSSRESKHAKIKRLFRFAIRQLYEEGSIVLWDGPVRALPQSGTQSLDALWKANVSTISAMSVISAGSQAEEDAGELSDPSPDEEAYIPLTPQYFADAVEHAIMAVQARAAAAAASKPRPRPRNVWDASAAVQSPPPGPTPAEILTWLRRDARWERVGEWTVKETLEWAKNEGRTSDGDENNDVPLADLNAPGYKKYGTRYRRIQRAGRANKGSVSTFQAISTSLSTCAAGAGADVGLMSSPMNASSSISNSCAVFGFLGTRGAGRFFVLTGPGPLWMDKVSISTKRRNEAIDETRTSIWADAGCHSGSAEMRVQLLVGRVEAPTSAGCRIRSTSVALCADGYMSGVKGHVTKAWGAARNVLYPWQSSR
ncbi:hypothetical protein POSPLADRAFT_1047308 [Postia placenta MAD-698-R-SB12]|uniref:Uncharacterized protein n=1 Tax=Postia placenta MAD-698-R-SB12 TaxID=670580 RepID=A0A1X6MXC9_9APHY|nr:hypothetical protein POSPLADRAFT_1047308 [Postia placenta MAD-698-R-SB12]OSX60999.1 hypothetical protein POSPLADRAFT_1047308 [Postia placenta MAD-698-R-SB12]